MKVNLKKIGAVLVGATILASSIGFAALTYGNVELVNANGQPTAKVVVGANAAASDAVAAASIASKIANKAYAKKTLKAQVSGTSTGETTCDVTDKSVTLKVTMPGLSSTQQAQFNLLIAENTDSDLADRDNSGDYYDVTSDFMDEDANPFQDQAGAVLGGYDVAMTNYDALLVDSNNFAPFQDVSMESSKFGTTATEYQRLYIQGGTQFDGDDAVAFYDDSNGDSSIVYQVLFGPSDNGLDVCPGDSTGTLGTCAEEDGLGAARYTINFLGQTWVISGLEYNGGFGTITTVLDNDEEVGLPSAGDFTLKLAKESAYGYVNVGECLQSGDTKVCLDDISEATGSTNIHPAIVSIYQGDSTTPVAQDQIDPGYSKEISVGGGNTVTVHVYQTAPGYTFGSSWAEMAIYEDEIKLESGKKFLEYKDLDPESDWHVDIAVSAEDAGTSATTDLDDVTHIKAITLWTDADAIDAVDEDGLHEGESVPVVDVDGYQAYEFEATGLEDYSPDTLKYEYKDSGKDFNGVQDPGTTRGFAGNVVAANYIKITSEQSEAFKTSTGKKGSELYLVWEDDGDGNPEDAGTDEYYVILRDKDGDYWGVDHIAANGNLDDLQYKYAGSDYGFIELIYNQAAGVHTFSIGVIENIGEISSTEDYDFLETTGDFAAGQFYAYGGTTSDDDKIFFNYNAAPDPMVEGLNYNGGSHEDEGFITLRGSVVDTLSDDMVKIKVSDKVREFVGMVKPVGSSLEPNTQIVGPLREGESATVGDVTIEVESIDVQTSTTTSGTSGEVSATIVDDSTGADLGSTVEAVTPYDAGKLVYLDNEVTDDTGVLITVGGNAVNTVSAAAMEEAGLSLSEDNPVLVETVGNKIVVAGYTAQDTLTAANQFLSALQES